ncbi:DUF4440 domain-containing protein [Aliikangiella sp. G2MR2-5]|uniref:nuclear transport factor 2 family protein n=1 Tax=Aliikangiella sp. G2MR2-5 TaxID=2788943 RepID=UPI001AED26CF
MSKAASQFHLTEATTKTIVALEESLFSSKVRLSAQLINSLLADEFKEITSTGRIYFKDEALSRLPTETPPEIQADNFVATRLDKNTYLLNYRSILKRNEGSQIYSLRSSIWQEKDGQWQMTFHQGTPCPAFDIQG